MSNRHLRPNRATGKLLLLPLEPTVPAAYLISGSGNPMEPVLPSGHHERIPRKSTERRGGRQITVKDAGPLTFGKMEVRGWLGAQDIDGEKSLGFTSKSKGGGLGNG